MGNIPCGLIMNETAVAIGPALRRPAKHQPCPRCNRIRLHDSFQPTKKPRQPHGPRGLNLQSVDNPARPYGLPAASKESVSRESVFMFATYLALTTADSVHQLTVARLCGKVKRNTTS